MKCSRCGNEGRDDDRYCTRCGTDLTTGAPASAPPGEKVPNYLVAGILITLCLCAPIGIVVIVYAAQADAKQKAGDLVGARECARKARGWAIAGGAIAIAVAILYLALLLFAPETLAD